jgi:hypothetical protein
MTSRALAPSRSLGLLGALLGLGLVGAACQDSAARCIVGGVAHPPNQTFSDGCNTCSCNAAGEVACTKRACLGDGGLPLEQDASSDANSDRNRDGAACDLSASYDYGDIGGLRISEDRSFLSPGNQYRHTRTSRLSPPGPELACSPALPACGALDAITAYDIEVHDLALPDVQSALAQATPPLYGHDWRPVDGTVFEFKRSDGRGFLVGTSCAGYPEPCTPPPPGIVQLEQRLLDLDAQQLADPTCQALRDPS